MLRIYTTIVKQYAALIPLIFLSIVCVSTSADDSASQFIEFDDRPLDQDIILPTWFKLSFLDLQEDIADLEKSDKKGLIVYFGRKDCPYCKTHLDKNWGAGNKSTVFYTQKYFDVVAIDVLGTRPVKDVSGVSYSTEKKLASKLKTNFTPSLLFYDRKGNEILRLSGYHPPYQFQAILEYIADKYYLKESLRDYLLRAETLAGYEETELNDNDVFGSPPYAFDRRRFASKTPLVVFFEQPTCHACDILHAGPLADRKIIKQLQSMETIQLDINADTPVLTPEGKRLTARQWAEELGIYYSPTILFFDEKGKEVIRIDSVVRFYRLHTVLHYVLTKGYQVIPNFQLWRQLHNR